MFPFFHFFIAFFLHFFAPVSMSARAPKRFKISGKWNCKYLFCLKHFYWSFVIFLFALASLSLGRMTFDINIWLFWCHHRLSFHSRASDAGKYCCFHFEFRSFFYFFFFCVVISIFVPLCRREWIEQRRKRAHRMRLSFENCLYIYDRLNKHRNKHRDRRKVHSSVRENEPEKKSNAIRSAHCVFEQANGALIMTLANNSQSFFVPRFASSSYLCWFIRIASEEINRFFHDFF